MKILVIDDAPDVIESVRLGFTLQWREVEVLGAEGGERGLDLVEQEKPDLVLLDVGLPDVDGYEVLRQIRAFSDVRWSCSPRATTRWTWSRASSSAPMTT